MTAATSSRPRSLSPLAPRSRRNASRRHASRAAVDHADVNFSIDSRCGSDGSRAVPGPARTSRSPSRSPRLDRGSPRRSARRRTTWSYQCSRRATVRPGVRARASPATRARSLATVTVPVWSFTKRTVSPDERPLGDDVRDVLAAHPHHPRGAHDRVVARTEQLAGALGRAVDVERIRRVLFDVGARPCCRRRRSRSRSRSGARRSPWRRATSTRCRRRSPRSTYAPRSRPGRPRCTRPSAR